MCIGAGSFPSRESSVRDYPGQMEFEFPKKFDPKEMGFVIADSGNTIFLSDIFISRELGLGQWSVDSFFSGRKTDIFCPFCGVGFLRVVILTPIYQMGHYVGIGCEFDCSNSCGGFFCGSVQWMYID